MEDEKEDVALIVLASGMVVPVVEESDHAALSAESVIGYEYEVLYPVAEIGIEEEIFELQDNGCACACAYGCHSDCADGIRRGGVGKTDLGASCLVGLSGGHRSGLPWLGISEVCVRIGGCAVFLAI